MEEGVLDLQSKIINVCCLQEDVIQSAKLANAHGFITALPDGYDTKVCIPVSDARVMLASFHGFGA